MEMIKEGDRVSRSGYSWRDEPSKFGTVTRCYYSHRSAVNVGVPLMDVKWDDGSTSIGHINGCGTVLRYISVPTFVVP